MASRYYCNSYRSFIRIKGFAQKQLHTRIATRTLDGICIEVEGKLYVTVRERHRGDRIMTKLRTSSARALLRRRFHAVRRFRGRQEDGTLANLRCGPCQDPSVCYANLLALVAVRSMCDSTTASRESPSHGRGYNARLEQAYRVYAHKI